MKARRSMATNDSDSGLEEEESSNDSEEEHGQGEEASVYLGFAANEDEETELEAEEAPLKSMKKDDFAPTPRKPLMAPRLETPKRSNSNKKRFEKDADYSESKDEVGDADVQESTPSIHADSHRAPSLNDAEVSVPDLENPPPRPVSNPLLDACQANVANKVCHEHNNVNANKNTQTIEIDKKIIH